MFRDGLAVVFLYLILPEGRNLPTSTKAVQDLSGSAGSCTRDESFGSRIATRQ